MNQMPWFRVYNEILSDRKIARICKKTGQSKALVVGVWVCILALASESPERGVLLLSENLPFSMEDLEDETGLPSEILSQLFDEFRALGMLEGDATLAVRNWEKRQFKSDNSTARVKEHRNRKRSDETLPKRSTVTKGNVIDTDTDTDTESDTEEESEKDYGSNGGGADLDHEFGALCTVYEKNIGPISPIISEELVDGLEEFGLQMCMDAISEALRNNVRKWSYVRGILNNWKTSGRANSRRSNGKGGGPPPLVYFDVGQERMWYQDGRLIRTEPIIGGES